MERERERRQRELAQAQTVSTCTHVHLHQSVYMYNLTKNRVWSIVHIHVLLSTCTLPAYSDDPVQYKY